MQSLGLIPKHHVNKSDVLLFGRWMHMNLEFKVTIGCLAHLRLAWVTRDCVLFFNEVSFLSCVASLV